MLETSAKEKEILKKQPTYGPIHFRIFTFSLI